MYFSTIPVSPKTAFSPHSCSSVTAVTVQQPLTVSFFAQRHLKNLPDSGNVCVPPESQKISVLQFKLNVIDFIIGLWFVQGI